MADHSTHHHEDTHTAHSGDQKSKTAFVSSFWFVIILVGLFIAAVNFVRIMSSNDEHGNKEATSSQTLKGESGIGREHETPGEDNSSTVPTVDSTSHEGQH